MVELVVGSTGLRSAPSNCWVSGFCQWLTYRLLVPQSTGLVIWGSVLHRRRKLMNASMSCPCSIKLSQPWKQCYWPTAACHKECFPLTYSRVPCVVSVSVNCIFIYHRVITFIFPQCSDTVGWMKGRSSGL